MIQKITDEQLPECKYCAGKVQRLVSLTNFQLKGTGWYATDYKGKGDKGEESAAKAAERADKKPDKKD